MLKHVLLLTLVSASAYGACRLEPQEIISRSLVGSVTLDRGGEGSLRLLTGSEEKTSLNVDNLYEISDGINVKRFRYHGSRLSGGHVYLDGVAWEGGFKPVTAGKYELYALRTRQNSASPTVTIIGDSITWWSYGRFLRCMLADYLPDAAFIGPHADPFGLGHAGEGGDKTSNILGRLGQIPSSDYYVLMAGTNDWSGVSADQTVANLQQISRRLSGRGGMVIIATLLPRLDQHADRNKEVNRLIRDWGGSGCNCQILDYESDAALALDERHFWDDGLHPNLAGYERLTGIIGPRLQKIILKN